MTIDAFMKKELTEMSENITSAYSKNMENRKQNPFLVFEDESAKKYMALGRSLDSQLGNRIQRIIFFLSRTKYKLCGVPNITVINYDEDSGEYTIKLYSIPIDLEDKWKNKGFNPFCQKVYVEKNMDCNNAKRKLHVKENCTELKEKEYKIKSSSSESRDEYQKWKGKNFPVDLLTFDISSENSIKDAKAYEIKMGGNLDTKNAPSNAEEVLKNKRLFSFIENNDSYFATCYGTCSEAVKNAIKKTNCTLLEPEKFWKNVLDSSIQYNEFIKKYKTAFSESGIESALKKL